MLLLTDRVAEGYKLQHALSTVQPFTLAPLHRTNQDRDHCRVVCDLGRDSVAAVDVVRES